uniref:Uncharacterized protein n=1 Tax=Fagus sylvatica TaxID=28930 RepID=A0A2N9IM20_FAGSY
MDGFVIMKPCELEMSYENYLGRSSSRSSGRSSLGNPPKTVSSAPPPARVQNQSGSIMGAIGASIADGMAWGAGTSIAHRAIDAIMGPRVIKHETVDSSETVAASATAAAPAPNTNNIGSSDVCVGQSKALTDLASYLGPCPCLGQMQIP